MDTSSQFKKKSKQLEATQKWDENGPNDLKFNVNQQFTQHNNEEINNNFSKFQRYMNFNIKKFQRLLEFTAEYKQNLMRNLDRIIQVIQVGVSEFHQKLEKVQKQTDQLNNNQRVIFDHFQSLENNLKEKELKDMFQNCFQQFSLITPFYELLDDQYKETIQFDCKPTQNINYNYSKIETELVYTSPEKVPHSCYSFEFNSENSILFVGSCPYILIYEFNNGKIQKELQKVQTKHHDCIDKMRYIKKSKILITNCSSDNFLIFWTQNEKGEWMEQSSLVCHEGTINSFLINKNEDMMISVSNDYTLKFWHINDKDLDCYQTLSIDNYADETSLNDMENKLLVLRYRDRILVVEKDGNDKKWKIASIIYLKQQGLRLCFTMGDQFVFQPQTKNWLEVYDYDTVKKYYKKPQQIRVQGCRSCTRGFSGQFITSLKLLIMRHGQFVNLFKIQDNGNYQLLQQFDFQSQDVQGRLSDDGQYIVTWDMATFRLQVKKITYIE